MLEVRVVRRTDGGKQRIGGGEVGKVEEGGREGRER